MIKKIDEIKDLEILYNERSHYIYYIILIIIMMMTRKEKKERKKIKRDENKVYLIFKKRSYFI